MYMYYIFLMIISFSYLPKDWSYNNEKIRLYNDIKYSKYILQAEIRQKYYAFIYSLIDTGENTLPLMPGN